MSPEAVSGPETPDLAEYLVEVRKKLKQSTASSEEAKDIAEELNSRYGFMEEKLVEIDAGQKFIVGDGIVFGVDESPRQYDISRSIEGLALKGTFKGFNVLWIRDQLVNRDTPVSYPEPCAVFIEAPKLIYRRPEPASTLMYVPVLRLKDIRILAENDQ